MQSKLSSIYRRASTAVVVLAVGVVLSAAAAYLVAGQVEREASLKFDSAVSDAKTAIESRVNAYADVLLGVRGLFIADHSVSRVEFKRYIDSLDLNRRYPGIQVIHYSRPVTAAERPAFEAMVRSDTSVDPRGYPDFAIRPAGNRPEYVVAQYVEPMAGNERALGLDLVGDAVRLAALDRTRESGQLTASGTIALAHIPERHPGFAMRLAVYRKDAPLATVAQRREAFTGVVSASFVAIDLMRGVLSQSFLQKIHVRIHDAGFLGSPGGLQPPTAENLMFDSDRLLGKEPAPRGLWSGEPASLSSVSDLEVGGRRWNLYFSARQELGDPVDRWLPWLVLLGGVTISLLLFGLTRSLATTARRAVKLANRITEDLRKSEASLAEAQRITQQLIEVLPNPIYFKGTDGRYLGVNKAWETYFATPRSAFLGKTVHDLYPDNPGIADRLHANDQVLWDRPRTPQVYETAITTPDGQHHDAIYYKATFTHADGGVAGLIGTIIDITDRKQAEQALRQSMLVLENTFEYMDQGISIVDADLQVVGMNRRFRELLDFPESMCKPNTPFTAFIRYNAERGDYGPGDVEEQVRTRVELARRFEPHRFERERPDGTILEIRGTPIPAGGFVTTYTDITQRARSERLLRESEARFRSLTELSSDWYWEQDETFRFVKFSAGADLHDTSSAHVGRTRWELPGVDGSEKRWAEHRETLAAHRAFRNLEFQRLTEGGEVIWISASGEPIFDEQGAFKGYRGIGSAITLRKLAEEALREQTERLQIGQKAAQMIILDRDIPNDRLTWSDSPEWLRGPLPPSGQYPLFTDQVHPEDRERFLATRALAIESLQGQSHEFRIVRTDGQVVWLLARQKVFADASGKARRMLVAMFDITERKVAERALGESEARFRSLTTLSSDWYWEQDENFRFTMVSRGIEDNIGIPPQQFIGKTRWEGTMLGLSEAEVTAHKATLEAHQPFADFEYGRFDAHGRLHYLSTSGEPIFDEQRRFRGYRGVGRDVTARRTAAEALRAAHDELARSNAELEQFAYVASHDLQEPLRMVSSYTQLLGKRFGERLEGDAGEFMAYIVDGAARMKQLIEDLLAYSRVGTRGKDFRPVSLEAVLRRATAILRAVLEESGAAVTSDLLPEVEADESQLVQLLQNLIGNALRFRSAGKPQVHVSAIDRGAEWEFSVKDNGIGIEPQYFERIFLVFQRLHDKGEYPGTGIGLAICKKVVDRHGGRIWVESRPGEGSTFHFTLPKTRGGNHHG